MKQRIMITRPAHQAGKLAQGIKTAGGETFLFPTLDILSAQLSGADKEKIQHIKQFDIIIFISSNAVEHGLNHIQATTELPEKILLATIGQGSAKTLKARLGKQPDIVPEKNFNSEGLLATAAMQNVTNKRILIIRGNDGREHLKQTLQQRGALVEYINVYQRIKPATNTSDLEQYLQNNQIAAIVITSAEGLKNLLELTPEKVTPQLLQVPLLLINKRLVDIAKKAGFNSKLFVATAASDDAIIESLKENYLLKLYANNGNHMTDAEKKSANIKKTELNETEKKTANKKTVKSVTPPRPHKSTSSNAGLFILLFFISLAATGGFYLLWENLQKNSIKQKISAQQIDQQITTLKQQQLELTEQNEKQIKNIHSYQENLRRNLTNLIRNNQHLRNDWLMAEAEYLIQLANHRLLLEKDVATAVVALKAADARLAETADPALLNIRKILANDLQILNNIPVVDLAGLSVTLSALSNNIPNLPLRTPDPETHKLNQAEKAQASSDIKSIQELPAAIWRDIKSLIVIRNHQKPLEPLLAPSQHFFLVQNLALLLEQSRLALLNGHNEIYQERLKTTEKWINQYFDTEHNVTRNMLANIDELQKFNIDPALPDISSTFSIIKKYRIRGQLPEAPVAKAKETS